MACPIAAYLLWSRGSHGPAVVALLWPLLILILPLPLMLVGLGPGRIGDIEKMFVQSLGYELSENN
jgi:hypothetical protein